MSHTFRLLGVDPGNRTGLAAIDVVGSNVGAPATSIAFVCSTTVDLAGLSAAVLRLEADSRTLGLRFFAAVESWQWQGPKRARGVPHAAFAAGYASGTLAARGIEHVLVTRTEALRGVGLRTSANKAAARRAAHALLPGFTGDEHAADAAIVALGSVGRFS